MAWPAAKNETARAVALASALNLFMISSQMMAAPPARFKKSYNNIFVKQQFSQNRPASDRCIETLSFFCFCTSWRLLAEAILALATPPGA
jgi:hypothetical protein